MLLSFAETRRSRRSRWYAFGGMDAAWRRVIAARILMLNRGVRHLENPKRNTGVGCCVVKVIRPVGMRAA